jgi:hypothetical protein
MECLAECARASFNAAIARTGNFIEIAVYLVRDAAESVFAARVRKPAASMESAKVLEWTPVAPQMHDMISVLPGMKSRRERATFPQLL